MVGIVEATKGFIISQNFSSPVRYTVFCTYVQEKPPALAEFR
jgi:hypothetical protein